MSQSRREVTVRRPNGTIEIIDVSDKFFSINDCLFAQIVESTRKAGRGECLNYRNIEAEPEEQDYQTTCKRCGAKIDSRTSYHQREHTRLGGALVPIEAHYCTACHTLLTQIGVGEQTAMDERAAYQPSYEPYTKED